MLDREIRAKFKEFQERTGKYEDLDIDEVRFDKKFLRELHLKEKVKIKKNTTADKFIEIGDIDRVTKKYDISKKVKHNLPLKGKYAPKGTILVSRVRPLLGGYTIIDGGDYTFVSGDLNPIVLPDNILVDYIFKIICSPKFEGFLKNNQNTAGQKPTITEKLYDFDVAIPKDLNENYTSFKIQEVIVEFLENWKVYCTNIHRERANKKKPIYEAIKKILVSNTFKGDEKLVKSFNQFIKNKGYKLQFKDIRFEKIDIFNDEENIELIGSKKIGSHEELEQTYDKDGLPVFDASSNILTYVKESRFIDKVFEVKDDKNPDISFATEGNSSAGTNFIIHNGKYYINNHRTVIKFSDKYYSKYIYFNIFRMKEQYGFKRGYIPSQQELKKINFLVVIPKSITSQYDSFFIQNIFVDFWEMIIDRIDYQLDICDKTIEVADKIDQTFLYRTFSKIDWSGE